MSRVIFNPNLIDQLSADKAQMGASKNPFVEIAKALFATRGLSINGEIYEFAELEFYMMTKEHTDPYTHAHPEQKQFGKWCFHRSSGKPSASYKGGTYKGLDLTLGTPGDSKSPGGHLGVLIRAIWNKEKGLICGPCKVVNHILSKYKVSSIVELTNNEPLDAHANTRKLHLVEVDHTSDQSIYVGARIGLSAKHPEWAAKPYRFVRRYTAGPFKLKTSLTKL
jgi:hypothetical protein